jgi:hypothetical protein
MSEIPEARNCVQRDRLYFLFYVCQSNTYLLKSKKKCGFRGEVPPKIARL